MLNLYLYQPQHNYKVGVKDQYWLPYAIGSLWAYAIQFDDVKSNWVLKEMGFRRDPIQDVVSRMQSPDLVGLSIYIWNRNYCIALGSAIKEKFPDTKIMIGGPLVNGSWSRYDWVDTIVLNEGEGCFVDILRSIAAEEEIDLFYKKTRMESLSGIPSPYVSGVFDELVSNHPTYTWAATLETNRGCPYSCTFCDWGGLTASKMKKFDLERIEKELEWIASNPCSSIFIADSNFGIFYERDKEIARMIRKAADQAGIDYISSNYLKNSNEHVIEIAKILGIENKGVTLSTQSMNPPTLDVIKRANMSELSIKNMFELCSQHNVPFYTELMLPLPLETKESWCKGLTDLLELGQHRHIAIIPTHIVENTELYDKQMSQYNMEIIEVSDSLMFTQVDDVIAETSPYIKKTSTMSTDDIVCSFMYAWMILNFHTVVGHSQWLSKYCRYVLNISFREFYDLMFKRLGENKDDLVRTQFKEVNQVVHDVWHHGKSNHPTINAKNMFLYSSKIFHEHFDKVHEFCLEIAQEFGEIDQGIIALQQRVVSNSFYTLPFEVNTKYDIHTWQARDCKYKINFSNLSSLSEYHDFWGKQRRQKMLSTEVYEL